MFWGISYLVVFIVTQLYKGVSCFTMQTRYIHKGYVFIFRD